MLLVGSGSYVVLSWVFLENIITTIASGPRVVFKSEYVHNVFLVSVLVSVSERTSCPAPGTNGFPPLFDSRKGQSVSISRHMFASCCRAELRSY